MASPRLQQAKGALDSIPPIAINALVAIITALIVLAGERFTATESADADKYIAALEASQEESRMLREENRMLREVLKQAHDELRLARNDIFDLKGVINQKSIELGRKWNNHQELRDLLDNSPLVMWLNRVEITKEGEIQFPMEHINPMYTFVHGVSLARYKGQLNSSVWSKPIADHFRLTNLKVFENKNGVCVFETYLKRTFLPEGPDNPMQKHRVCKWLIPFENGFAIVGQASEPVEVLSDETKR